MATTEKETTGAVDTDLIQLDAFLRSDNAPPECMMLSDLDGFLTGIAVGPELILPSEWLPVVWGEEAATFANETQARIVLAAIMGHYNQILRQIDERAPQPILWRTSDGILRSRQKPKILWVDDAEVVGDRITKACPVLGDFVAQEIERGVRELSTCGVAFVVRDIPVHEAP